MTTPAEIQAAVGALAGRDLTWRTMLDLGLTPVIGDGRGDVAQFVGSSLSAGVPPQVGAYIAVSGDANAGGYGGLYQLRAADFSGSLVTPLGNVGPGGEYGAWAWPLTYRGGLVFSVGSARFLSTANNANATLLDRVAANLYWIGPLIAIVATYGVASGMVGASGGVTPAGLGAGAGAAETVTLAGSAMPVVTPAITSAAAQAVGTAPAAASTVDAIPGAVDLAATDLGIGSAAAVTPAASGTVAGITTTTVGAGAVTAAGGGLGSAVQSIVESVGAGALDLATSVGSALKPLVPAIVANTLAGGNEPSADLEPIAAGGMDARSLLLLGAAAVAAVLLLKGGT